MRRVIPDVPPSARATVIGRVRVSVRVTVDPQGNVANAEFDSPGPSHYFSRLAMEAAQGWKFVPDLSATTRAWILQFGFGNDDTVVTPVKTAAAATTAAQQ